MSTKNKKFIIFHTKQINTKLGQYANEQGLQSEVFDSDVYIFLHRKAHMH